MYIAKISVSSSFERHCGENTNETPCISGTWKLQEKSSRAGRRDNQRNYLSRSRGSGRISGRASARATEVINVPEGQENRSSSGTDPYEIKIPPSGRSFSSTNSSLFLRSFVQTCRQHYDSLIRMIAGFCNIFYMRFISW